MFCRHACRVGQRDFDEALRVFCAEHQTNPPAEGMPEQIDVIQLVRVEIGDNEIRVVRYAPGARRRIAFAETGQIRDVDA